MKSPLREEGVYTVSVNTGNVLGGLGDLQSPRGHDLEKGNATFARVEVDDLDQEAADVA